jgi:DNA-binding transcriptional ArsR family regulator
MPRRPAAGIELLADPTRRLIVGLLLRHARRPSQIAAAIELSRPATTRQLSLLREAGLIRTTYSPIDGRARLYAVTPMMIRPIGAWLAGVEVGRPVGLTIDGEDGATTIR